MNTSEKLKPLTLKEVEQLIGWGDCGHLTRRALAQLREMLTPVRPISCMGLSWLRHECGKCSRIVESRDEFCPRCGHPLLWDEKEKV